ncbi:lytic transglycosylase domain-containing protein [Alkalimarinus sediminis]|uniref:Lytic transglycosylase domain-containing protein n=1 Tax=Alkalimarinus sediminis TaxID=1632866 RepID=A0A9E8KR97_9ALTE|nr:lytic transglycosylase domain-containing protein [Alkalimarinus sediminis]UZW75802.1 lytic transglycosylase domain-containing protein [Alkalimarinus sediminis]
MARSRLRSIITTIVAMMLTTSAISQTIDPELRAALKQNVNESSSFEDRFDAEVWLVDMSGRMSRYIKDPQQRLELLRKVHREATKAGVEPELVLSVIHIESHFDRFAISRVGAQGLMQVMPFWKSEIGRPTDNLTNVDTNLRYGCTILKHYIDREKGDLIRALARYNGSLGKTWYPEKVLTAWEKYWFVNNI